MYNNQKHFALCCIGHITLDKIVTPTTTAYLPGGTSYYFSHGLRHLNQLSDYLLVTSLAESEYAAVDELRMQGVEVTVIPSPHTVYFENIYGENPDDRTQRVLAKAAPFTIDNLKDLSADTYHLGSLLADDFSLDVIRYLSSKGTLSVDAQGYLRKVRGTDVVAVDWPEKRQALPHIDILKVNEHEARVLTGIDDLQEAAHQLGKWGVKEVLLTLGSQGSIIYTQDTFYSIPAYPPKVVADATGCGDTYVMGYLYKRSNGAGIEEAGKFAAALSTLKLEQKGPFCGTEEEVYQLIQSL